MLDKIDSSKVCLATFIYGKEYQNYIPLLLYSCHNAYPEYKIVIFIFGELQPNIKRQIESIELNDRVVIKEHCFEKCTRMNSFKSKALRWILWDEIFLQYDYLYIIDVDMFYIKEVPMLHMQHIEHMDYIGLPISNLRRASNFDPFALINIAIRFKRAKFVGILNFFFGRKKEYKLTGLHFVKIKEYYARLNNYEREKIKKQIYNNRIFKFIRFPNNEILLHYIVKKLGYNTEKIGVQTDSVTMLNFSCPRRKEFRPHHGIHLGIFRRSVNELRSSVEDVKILESSEYHYYIEIMKKLIADDKNFHRLLRESPGNIKNVFGELFKYYGIEFDLNQI